jgi:hypothetical protein
MLGHCFFSANQAKMANCVSASAAAQYIEVNQTQTKTIRIAKVDLIVNIDFLKRGCTFRQFRA